MQDAEDSLQKLMVLIGPEESIDTSFTLASFVLGYLRNLSSVAIFMLPNADDPSAMSACLETISEAVRHIKIHRGTDEEFEGALNALKLTTSPCHSVLREALLVLREDYLRVRAFFSRRLDASDISRRGAQNALGAVETFMLRSVDPILQASFASLELLVLLAGDAHIHCMEPPRCEECTYLVIVCWKDLERIYKVMHPLHQRNILRSAVLLTQ